MYLDCSNNLKCLLLLTTAFAILGTGCSEGEGGTSVIVEKDRSQVSAEPYIPQRSLKAKKPIEFNVINSENPLQIDAEVVKDFFEHLKNTEDFVREIENDTTSVVNFVYNKQLVNDLNQDGISDVAFLIQKNPNDKKSFTRHYVFAFNNGEELVPVEYFFAGNYESELITQFESITDSSIVKGYMLPNHYVKSKDKFPIDYVFDGLEFVRK